MRAIAFISRALLFALAFCLAIAPICSARCALSSCLPAAPNQSSGDCHHHAAPHQSHSLDTLAANSCQTTDALLTTLPANLLRSLQPIATHVPASPAPSAAVKVSLTQHPLRLPPPDSSPGKFSLSPATPLRL